MNQLLLPLSLLLLLIIILGFMAVPEDKVVFLDVGQGDAVLLQHQTSQVLIDGGRGTAVLSRLAEELPWFDRSIEVVIATHPDQDHLEGLLHVLQRYEVKLVILPQIPHDTDLQEEWLTRLQAAVKERGVQYRFAWEGQRIKAGELEIQILSPFDNGTFIGSSKSNDASVITRIDMYGRSFMLTGDAEKKVENMLVQRYEGKDVLDVDILKAGHHGSNTSTHAVFLQETTPSAAVISVGEDNRYGHPHALVLKRLDGMPLWRTDEDGSIRFVYDQNSWLVSTTSSR